MRKRERNKYPACATFDAHRFCVSPIHFLRIFDLNYFRRSPQAFLALAKELWPGMHQRSPTLTHAFLALLAQKDLLLRCYTQNIDGLEFLAGVPASRLLECHGHFRSATCTNCGAPADIDVVRAHVIKGTTKEPPTCDQCGTGYIKPGKVFKGISLAFLSCPKKEACFCVECASTPCRTPNDRCFPSQTLSFLAKHCPMNSSSCCKKTWKKQNSCSFWEQACRSSPYQ